MKRIGIYPGSFDPITNGHLDIIKRASKLFDEVIVLVAVNNHKKNRFDVNTRVRLIKESIKCFNNVSVDYFNGLIVEYAKMHNAVALIRGIRVSSDFEYEWELAAANEYIDPEVEMVFLMSHKENTFISSSAINELFLNGVDISPLVPKVVLEEYLKNS